MHDNFYRENKNSHEYKHNITLTLTQTHTYILTHTTSTRETRHPQKDGVRHQSDYPGKSRQTKRE